MQTVEQCPAVSASSDGLTLRRWFGAYAIFLLCVGIPFVIFAMEHDWTGVSNTSGMSFREKWDGFWSAFAHAPAVVKLLGFAIYISLCCTFLPLPTGAIVAAVATQNAAIAGGFWPTVILIAAVGGLASTIANLNDYHIFTWMLRHHRIAKIRNTRIYGTSAKWFQKSPLAILIIFNIIPIPVDVIRMLAATNRYPRLPFAIGNFIGRFIRYGVIAGVTYHLGEKGWWAVVVLLGAAVVVGIAKIFPPILKKIFSALSGQDLRINEEKKLDEN